MFRWAACAHLTASLALAQTVDTTADAVTAGPDGVCDVPGVGCTLREALLEAGAVGTPTVVDVPAGTYVIDPALGSLRADGLVEIRGAGPLSTTIDAAGALAGPTFEILGGISMRGLGIVGADIAGNGGALDISGSLVLEDARLADNRALVGGAAINRGTLLMRGVEAENNRAQSGGAVFNGVGRNGAPGMLLIEGSRLHHNTASQDGGAVMNTAIAGIQTSDLMDNSATSRGGAIASATEGAVLRLDASRLYDNTAYDGGGLAVYDGSATVNLVEFRSNHAFDSGGGAFNFGQITITRSTFRGNSVGANSGIEDPNYNKGGAFANVDGVANLERVSIVSNSADQGGGIYAGRFDWEQPGRVRIVNSTLANNYGRAEGGAIVVFRGEVEIEHSTVAFNRADYDGASFLVSNDSPPLSLHSSIVDGDVGPGTSGDCWSNRYVSLGHNLVQSADCLGPAPAPTDIVGPTSLFPLMDLASPGRSTVPLRSTSSAINNGDDPSCNAIASSDQIFFPRFRDCDIGAREYFELVAAPNVGPQFDPWGDEGDNHDDGQDDLDPKKRHAKPHR